MNKALIVGIDYYPSSGHLHGCVDDAHAVSEVLATHGDGSGNFSVQTRISAGPANQLSQNDLRDLLGSLFSNDCDTALFFFAGYGHIGTTGGYLLTSECRSGDDGLALGDILTYAKERKARDAVIVLDSCHAGVAGALPSQPYSTELTEGVALLAGSTAEQYATVESGHGAFTTLFVDALNGSAANLVGDVTLGGVYAHVEHSLGAWEQRPLFTSHIKRFVSLRRVQPPVPYADLQRITEFFPTAGYHYQLDPSYESRDEGRTPEMPKADPENNRKFAILQKFNRVNLVVPVNATHMWNAAMESKACRLTVLGEHYRRLRARGRF